MLLSGPEPTLDAERLSSMSFEDLDTARLRCRVSEKWRRHGGEILPAWVAEMDFPLAEPIRDVLTAAVDNHDFGYPPWPHEMGLPRAFAERMQARYGWHADPDRVEVLSDVVQGITLGLLAYTAPGDAVLVQTPIYPPFLGSVRQTGRRLVTSALIDGGGGFEIDFEHLREVSQGAKVLLLCHPHNPTGRVFTRAELGALAELAVERDWLVLSDEIHADLTFSGQSFVPFAALGPEIAARTVTLTSASKAFNIAGLRCAVAHFGTRALHERFNAVLPPHVRGGLGILGLYCTLAAWQSGGAWLEQVRSTLDGHRHWLLQQFKARLPQAVVHLPEATYLAWLDLRKLELPTSPAAFFHERARVALSDGAAFGGEDFRGYARLNYATSRAILSEILERIFHAAEAPRGTP